MADSRILNITEMHDEDESIRSYQYYQYSPITGTNLNNSGEIRMTIESQDEFFHPHSSYLLFTGRLVKAAGGAYADTELASLTNNGIMYLFSNIRYELSGHEIESINYPGTATTIQGLLKYSDDFSKSQGMNMCWIKDTGAAADANNKGFIARHAYIVKKPTPNGEFSFAVSLSHIFGFCEDYDKVVYGMKHMLTLVRTSDDDAIFRAVHTSAAAGKVVLDNVSWYMPRVFPSDSQKLMLYKIIENKPTLNVGFRMRQCDTITVSESTSFTWRLSVRSAPERPRHVIIALQTDKGNDQEKNAAIFDHCGVKNMHVILNSDRYPTDDYNASFTTQNISRFYKDAADFISAYSGVYNTQCNISPDDYTTLFPIFVFDVSKQSERLKTGIVDVTVKMEFSAAVAAKTQAYAVVLCDRIIKFQGDGSRMNVVI